MVAYAYVKQKHEVQKEILRQNIKLLSTCAINILISYKTRHCNNQCGIISKNELAELLVV